MTEDDLADELSSIEGIIKLLLSSRTLICNQDSSDNQVIHTERASRTPPSPKGWHLLYTPSKPLGGRKILISMPNFWPIPYQGKPGPAGQAYGMIQTEPSCSTLPESGEADWVILGTWNCPRLTPLRPKTFMQKNEEWKWRCPVCFGEGEKIWMIILKPFHFLDNSYGTLTEQLHWGCRQLWQLNAGWK